ncbi:MAG: hypothetical protein OSB01_06735 [Nitrosomonadaceae bacterium]|nr:hypothetical protein [Nitrosomonadaceae bacterium]
MKKILLILMLFVVSNGAMAEWVYINKSFDTFYYINPETIQKSGNTVKMWILGDFIEARNLKNGVINSSIRDQAEYRCKERQNRSNYQVLYTENMGEGEIIHTFDQPGEWKSVIPESVGETHFEFACKK